jgi:hypothetical protein
MMVRGTPVVKGKWAIIHEGIKPTNPLKTVGPIVAVVVTVERALTGWNSHSCLFPHDKNVGAASPSGRRN